MATIEIQCNQCRNILRVPTKRGVVTCPHCRNKWDWDPQAVNRSFLATDVASDLVLRLRNGGAAISEEQSNRIKQQISAMVRYTPRVGILGKTGAGKSSLCNALFGGELAPVSDVGACTRESQEIGVGLNAGRSIVLVDMPGVGESIQRDEEYSSYYERTLPELDLVLWAMKADDRAYSVDERFYRDVVRKHLHARGTPIIFVLTQVDKIEPVREWDTVSRLPGATQGRNIGGKLNHVREVFELKWNEICAVSANEHYGLVDLVSRILLRLPREKRYGFTREVKQENVSLATKTEVENDVWSIVKDVVGAIVNAAIPVLQKIGFEWLKKQIL